MKKLLFAVFTLITCLSQNLHADEGMWLPFLLEEQKITHMQQLGLQLSAEEVYHNSQPAVTNAVVGLMGEGSNLRSYGTASFISEDGLLLTNHHIILSFLERFSSSENDFIKYGYWARDRSEESLCRGLSIKQLVRMEDVTERMMEGTEGLSGQEFLNKVNANGRVIAEEATEGTHYQVRMQPLFGSSQFIMHVYAVYSDVRMVAAPPFALGKFGGNQDNYSWPRHTADFAVLRVYAGPNNEPARHSPDNVPYNPPHYLPIARGGVQENDFVMVMGFPGNTRQYIPSFALERIIYGETADKLAIARDKMQILERAIEDNPDQRYRYTTRLASVGNSYLRWKGEFMGVNRMDLVNVKRREEAAFNQWANATPERKKQYGDILQRMEEHYQEVAKYNMAHTYFLEAGINGAEIVPFIGKFEKLVAMYNRQRFNATAANREASNLVALTEQFFRNWNYEVDRRFFRNLTYRYYQNVDEKFQVEELVKAIHKYDGDIELLSSEVFANSIFTDKERLIAMLESEERDIENLIRQDELYQIAIGFYRVNVDNIVRQRGRLQTELIDMHTIFLRGLREMNEGVVMYPEADNSLRISYGTVRGTDAADGLHYYPFTTFAGIHEKYVNNPDDEEYYLPRRLQELYANNDFGSHAQKAGSLPVNFLSDAHTTSGSSGSPVVNAKGELVGLNFDRTWQATSSDYRYDPERTRQISVDIRYIMFLLDKYSPSRHVIDEINKQL